MGNGKATSWWHDAYGKTGNARFDSTQLHKFKAWADGRTGYPYVDSHMRELKATGFMGNRGRQNVASFLVYNLRLDWRWGAMWFENTLLDHDPASNYGNWQTIAGIGYQDRENVFNIVKQSKSYDGPAVHIRYWIPELSKAFEGHGANNTLIHTPWDA